MTPTVGNWIYLLPERAQFNDLTKQVEKSLALQSKISTAREKKAKLDDSISQMILNSWTADEIRIAKTDFHHVCDCLSDEISMRSKEAA